MMKKLLLVSVSFFSSIQFANAGIVVFSGGGSPQGNHYSQYLQTKSLTDGLRERFGWDSVSVAFGVGNQVNSNPLLADVVRQSTMKYGGEDYTIQEFIVGSIEGNHQANRTQIQNILNHQAKADNPLFVLISDHGNPNREEKDPEFNNNCITLWGLDTDHQKVRKESEICYSRERFETDLAALPSKRIVYGMTQCFSGGFHRMSVKRTPEGVVSANPNLCGFAAATVDLTASGCTDKVDGPGYAGYERFFTSQILGKDFISHEKTGFGEAGNLREAHLRAKMQDFVGDIPNATSDYYLLELMESLNQTKSNKNFNPRLGERKLHRRIAFFANLEKGEDYFKMHPTGKDTALYHGMVEEIRQWVKAAKGSGLPDADVLLVKDIDALKKERHQIERERVQAETEMEAASDKIDSIEEGLFKNPELSSKVSDPLIEELGLGPIHSVTKDELVDLAPLIATKDQEAGRFVGLYKKLRRFKTWDYLETHSKELSKELSDHSSEVNALYATYSDIAARYAKSNLRFRLVRSLLRMRNELGILGAAIQTESHQVVETYRALLSCESTPLDQAQGSN